MIGELDRLLHPTDAPTPGGMTVAVVAMQPERTLRRARQAMAMAESAALLREHTPDEATVLEALTAWLAHHLDAPLAPEWVAILASDGRDWFWWSAEVSGPTEITLTLQLEGFPVSGFSALRALLIGCGAAEVTQNRR